MRRRTRPELRSLTVRDAGACVAVSGRHPRYRTSATAYVMKSSIRGMGPDEKSAYLLDVFEVVARPVTGKRGAQKGIAQEDARSAPLPLAGARS